MQYIGIQTQQSRNNLRSAFLLFLFPCLVAALLYLSCYLLVLFGYGKSMEIEIIYGQVIAKANNYQAVPGKDVRNGSSKTTGSGSMRNPSAYNARSIEESAFPVVSSYLFVYGMGIFASIWIMP
mgnify:CR=1 FL=1